MSTVTEIEAAIHELRLEEKQRLFGFLAHELESQAKSSEFPDLKALLLRMPNFGDDSDFERIREMPKDYDWS